MKPLKIAGLVVLVLWMAFITYEVERAVAASQAACTMAFAVLHKGQEGIMFCPQALRGWWP